MELRRPPACFESPGGGGGGPTEVHILYPKKSQLQNLSFQKKSLLFLAYPKKSLSHFCTTQKNPFWFFFTTQKNPSVFHRPQKSLLAKISDPKKSLATPPPPPPSLKYMSGAPGLLGIWLLGCLKFVMFLQKNFSLKILLWAALMHSQRTKLSRYCLRIEKI